jgi:hypothetical protein
VEDEVSRNLEEEVTEKEDAGSRCKNGIREPRNLLHSQFGEADIDSVNVGEDIAGEEDGDEPEGNLAIDRRLR